MKSTRAKLLSVVLFTGTVLATSSSHAIGPDNPLWTVIGPARPLEDPDLIFMKSVEITYPTAGTGLPMTFHVYDPWAQGLNFNLSSKTTSGAVDNSSTFTNVHVSAITRDANGKWG